MSLRRVLATTVVSTLVAATATTIGSTPASAGVPPETRIVSGGSGPWIYANNYQDQPGAVVTGGTISLSINVETTDGADVFDGTLRVQRRLAGATGWRTVATSDTAWLYDSITAERNATYKVTYDGGGLYGSSEASRTMKVQKRLAMTVKDGRRFGLAGKISPRGKNRVVVLKKKGPRWRKYKVVSSNRRGRFFAALTAPRRRGARILWKVQIAGSNQYATSTSATYYTTRYRPVARS